MTDQENLFSLDEADQKKLAHALEPFFMCLLLSNEHLMGSLKEKSASFSEEQISFIRAIQLIGAMDYIAQSEGWTVEKLIVPISEAFKREPFEYDIEKSFEIIGLLRKPTPEIINVQINGANLFDALKNLISQGSEKFPSGILKISRANANEIYELISRPLIELADSVFDDLEEVEVTNSVQQGKPSISVAAGAEKLHFVTRSQRDAIDKNIKYPSDWDDDHKKYNTAIYLNDRHVGYRADGKYTGQGTNTSVNGDQYVGEWRNGSYHGQGTRTWTDGRKYVGEWRDGLQHGQGTYILEGRENKDVGESRLVHLIPCNTGSKKFTKRMGDEWISAYKYVGEWRGGFRHGHGTYTYADGDQYVGELKHSKYHGHGTYTSADGTAYSGEWRLGEFIENFQEEKTNSNRKSKLEVALEYFFEFAMLGLDKMWAKPRKYSILGNPKKYRGNPVSTAAAYAFRQNYLSKTGIEDYGVMFFSKIEIEALAFARHHYNKGNLDLDEIFAKEGRDLVIPEVRAYLKNILRNY